MLPQLPSRLLEREPCAASHRAPAAPCQSVSLVVGSFAVGPSWLSYAWRLDDGPPLLYDPAVERLRRQLGVGGRWAWQEVSGAELLEPEEQAAEGVQHQLDRRQGHRASGNRHDARGRMPGAYLPSLRGRGRRRSIGQRCCRGRALAGATEVRIEDWLLSALPEELKVSIYDGPCRLLDRA